MIYERSTEFCEISTTTASEEEAYKIGEKLININLSRCVNIHPVLSIYTWQGKLEKNKEWKLKVKSSVNLVEAVCEEISKEHSYEVPEILVHPITGGGIPYMQWLRRDESAKS